jgi:hypothetical protein
MHDILVYRIPADAIRPVLEWPHAARFVARSMNKGVRLLAGHEPTPVPTRAGRGSVTDPRRATWCHFDIDMTPK